MLTEITHGALEYICLNMREVDRVEIFNLLDHDNPLRLAWDANALILNKGRGRIGWAKGRPAAVGAFTEDRSGVWQVWMFGTDDFKHAAVDMLRWFRKEANEILTVCKGHRLQCDSRVGHEEAHKMLKALGALPDGPPMRRYGKDMGDYQRFVWLNGENDAVLRPHFTRAA